MIEVLSPSYRIKNSDYRGPRGTDWKHFGGNAAMVPDRGFRKQLKALDKELEVVWDWGSSKWEIWRIPENGKPPCHMITVETKDKKYRELGADVLLQLQKGDPNRFTVDQMVAYFDELDRQEQRRRQKDFSNKIRSIAKETFRYAQGIPQIQVPKKFSIGRVVKV